MKSNATTTAKQTEIADKYDGNPHLQYTFFRKGNRYHHCKIINDHRPIYNAVRIALSDGKEWVVRPEELGPKPITKRQAQLDKNRSKRRSIGMMIMGAMPETGHITMDAISKSIGVSALFIGKVIKRERLPLQRIEIDRRLFWKRKSDLQDPQPAPESTQEAKEPQSCG